MSDRRGGWVCCPHVPSLIIHFTSFILILVQQTHHASPHFILATLVIMSYVTRERSLRRDNERRVARVRRYTRKCIIYDPSSQVCSGSLGSQTRTVIMSSLVTSLLISAGSRLFLSHDHYIILLTMSINILFSSNY